MPDRIYGNISKAYRSFVLPEIGQSDHQAIHLVPSYLPVIKSNPVVKKSVKIWSKESTDELKACFECTNLEEFIDSSSSVEEATTVISDYIVFCEEMIIPKKDIKVYPNNKPYISKSIKDSLLEKKVALKTGDRVEKKRVLQKVRSEIREEKEKYKKRVEVKFACGQKREGWEGVKILTGQKKVQQQCSLPEEERENFANSLNDFYCRFEREDLKEELDSALRDLRGRAENLDDDQVDFEIDAEVVEKEFRKLNIRKAVGPDGISGRLLRFCCSELSQIFSILFSWSLRDCIVPSLWKRSIICPVPKSKNPKELNDFRPVALTPIAMKCLERIVLGRLQLQTQHALDPLQFAYKQNRSTDDATLTLLHNAYTHLDTPKSFVRILFIDFSSAFNTIQPHLMILKLLNLSVCPKLILWIVSFLVHRSQAVSFHNSLSFTRSTSTGSPQGTVLSPVLFNLYTNDCSGTSLTPVIKYSDNTAIQDLSNSDTIFTEQVHKFTSWCKDNYLDLNVKKTKEMIIDFRREPCAIPDLYIDSIKVERVEGYKYLGAIVDNKLTFSKTHKR